MEAAITDRDYLDRTVEADLSNDGLGGLLLCMESRSQRFDPTALRMQGSTTGRATGGGLSGQSLSDTLLTRMPKPEVKTRDNTGRRRIAARNRTVSPGSRGLDSVAPGATSWNRGRTTCRSLVSSSGHEKANMA